MRDYPVLFDTSELVRCGRFVALVKMSGRVRIAFEDDEWWCYGVNPGGASGSGTIPLDAYRAFRAELSQGLNGMAELARDGAEFKTLVQSLFETNGPELARWEAAQASLSGFLCEADPGHAGSLPSK